MTTTQVVETSVTNNSLSKGYPHPNNNAKQTNKSMLADVSILCFVEFLPVCSYCFEHFQKNIHSVNIQSLYFLFIFLFN